MIDYTRDELMSEQGLKLVKDYYLLDGEKSPQDAYMRAAKFFSYGDDDFAQRIYDYVSNQWFMFSSPILSNAHDGKGLPISCFLSYVPDTVEGLIEHNKELKWLSVLGGGVGGHWSDVRAVSNKAPGPIPFIHDCDASITAYKQGKTRKGAYAAYLDVSHPDILEFLQIRVPTGGDINRKCLNIHNAVNITDAFMEAVFQDKDWDLIDPASKEIRDTVKARDVWTRILEVRHRTGEPFLNFIDEINRHLHPAQTAMGLKVNGSNLCLVGETKVNVKIDGVETTVRLDEAVELFKNHKVEVRNYNINADSMQYDLVTDAACTAYTNEVYEITDGNSGKSIRCTPHHKIYTKNRGYVMAKDLIETDELLLA